MTDYILTDEELHLMIDNDNLVIEYDLIDMYSICEGKPIQTKYHICVMCNKLKNIEEYTTHSFYRYKRCKKCTSLCWKNKKLSDIGN